MCTNENKIEENLQIAKEAIEKYYEKEASQEGANEEDLEALNEVIETTSKNIEAELKKGK